MIDPAKELNFSSREWAVLKAWVEQKKITKIGLLINEESPSKSDQIRGALQFITEFLALESAANSRH